MKTLHDIFGYIAAVSVLTALGIILLIFGVGIVYAIAETIGQGNYLGASLLIFGVVSLISVIGYVVTE